MFRYTPISIVFVVLLLASILQVQYEDSPWWIITIPIVLFVTILIIGSFKISLNFFLPSISNLKTSEKVIAITFDDGPNPDVTPGLLDLLLKENISATFFCTGSQVERYPEILKNINGNGHLVGNHTYSHNPWFAFYPAKKMILELEKTNDIIEKVLGKKPLLFRPPYGVTNPSLRTAIEETGLVSVGWSLRSFDTIKTKEKVLRKLKRKTKAGDVVLFHDNDEKILWILKEYFSWLNTNNFKIVSLAQLFDIEAYENV